MSKVKIPKEQRKAIRSARRMLEQAVKMDANEAETRRRLERMFKKVMGYDVLKHP